MKKIIIISLAIFNIAASLPSLKVLEEIEIVDGQDIDISKVPYQVVITWEGKQHCGGSIINKNYILTAAHCKRAGRKYKIRAGSNSWKSGGVEVNVVNFTIHPEYVNGIYDYDIAIIQLEKPLEFTEKIAPAKLADKSYEVKDSEIVQVTGWGRTWEGSPEKLQGVKLTKLNFDECVEDIKYFFGIILSRNFICGLHPDDGHNACQGDSGGPLTHNGTQVGVVSFGGPCNGPGAPVAYTSVAVFRDWIDLIARHL